MNSQSAALQHRVFSVVLIALSTIALYYISTINYLLFHGIVELLSIIIACCFFMIAWNIKSRISNPSLVYLGTAYFFVAALDLTHTLSYKGMRIFEYDYYASDLWIAARYMESISLLLFFSISDKGKRISYELVFGIYLCLTSLIIASIYYWKIFPVCFIEGKGQTNFKIYSEYIICLILIFSAFALHHKRKLFGRTIRLLLYWSVIFTIAAELSFSIYENVYGLPNFIGHIFKLISFYLMYKAVIETGLRQPFNLIFKELKEKEELLNTTQEIARVGGWDYDLTENKMSWTEETYRIREVPYDYPVSFENALSFYTPDSALKFRETFRRLVNEGGTDDLELQMRTAKNREIWVRVTFATQTKNEKIVRISGIIQDITEQKNTEKLREDFERITRHDLKTPLNSIYLASQLFENDEISPKERKKITRIIQNSVYKLLDMINLSLSLYKIEEGVYKLAPAPFDLINLLKRVANDYHLNMKAKKISLLITVNGKYLDKNTPPFEVNGEEALMYSMFSNLYKNAVEASPEKAAVKIKIIDKGKKYSVEINNKGVVPPELRDRFFNKYATSGKKGGTGLGTYSAWLISKLHKGNISMSSSEKAGTSIVINLSQKP